MACCVSPRVGARHRRKRRSTFWMPGSQLRMFRLLSVWSVVLETETANKKDLRLGVSLGLGKRRSCRPCVSVRAVQLQCCQGALLVLRIVTTGNEKPVTRVGGNSVFCVSLCVFFFFFFFFWVGGGGGGGESLSLNFLHLPNQSHQETRPW